MWSATAPNVIGRVSHVPLCHAPERFPDASICVIARYVGMSILILSIQTRMPTTREKMLQIFIIVILASCTKTAVPTNRPSVSALGFIYSWRIWDLKLGLRLCRGAISLLLYRSQDLYITTCFGGAKTRSCVNHEADVIVVFVI